MRMTCSSGAEANSVMEWLFRDDLRRNQVYARRHVSSEHPAASRGAAVGHQHGAGSVRSFPRFPLLSRSQS